MSTPARHLVAPEQVRPVGDPLLVRARARGASAAEALTVAVPAARPGGHAPGRTAPGRTAPGPTRPVEKPAPPALKVVPRRVRRRRAGLVIATGVTFMFVLMLGLVAFQAKIAQSQMKLDRTERALREAETRYAQLRLQVAQLEAPTRVIEAAKNLGLVRPAPEDVTYLTATADALGQVAAAGGAEQDTPDGTADASEWANLKPLLQAAP